MVDLALRLERQPDRDRACAVLRLGAEESRRADADRASRSSARSREVEELRRKHHGRIVIDAVVPDYHARFPKPCVGGWGRRSLNVTPSGKRAAVPRRGDRFPGLEFWNVREHSLHDIWASIAGLQRLSRHRLPAGAVRELRAARDRFRRLPLPGLPADRRCPGDRSGLPLVAASCAGRRTRRQCRKMWPTTTGECRHSSDPVRAPDCDPRD